MKLRKKNCLIAVLGIMSICAISFLIIDKVFLKSSSDVYKEKNFKEESPKNADSLPIKEEIKIEEVNLNTEIKEEIEENSEVINDKKEEVTTNNKATYENKSKKANIPNVKVRDNEENIVVVDNSKEEVINDELVEKKIINIEKISYSKNLIKMVVGETIEINPTVFPNDATNKELEYSTNNSNMLSVSQDGKITALKTSLDPAYVYIRSKENSEIYFMIKIYVFDDIKIQSLSFPKSVDTVDIATNGIIYKLKVNAPSTSYSNYTYTGIWMEYISSNPDVARVQVSNFDTLYLNKPGTTIITARYRDGKTAQMELHVINSKDDQRPTDEILKYVVDENEKELE